MKTLNNDNNSRRKILLLHNTYLAITAAATIFTLTIIFASTSSSVSASTTGNNTTTTTTDITESLGNPFFVEQGRIIGQRVLAVTPQPQLEFSFMANATINNGGDIVINAQNTGTSVSTLNADGTFRGEGQGILR